MNVKLQLLFVFFLFHAEICNSQSQTIGTNNGVTQMIIGNNNVTIGTIYLTRIIKNNVYRNGDFATLKIKTNTRCTILEDNKTLGETSCAKILKLKLSKGIHAFRIISHYSEYGFLNCPVDINKELLGTESYIKCNFSISGQLLPVLSHNNQKYGYYNRNTHELAVPFLYNSAEKFSEKRAAVKVGTNWGYIDEMGEEIIPFKYTKVEDFKDGIAIVDDGKFVNILNIEGKNLTEGYELNFIRPFDRNITFAGKSFNKWGLLGKEGKFIIEPKYTIISGNFTNGYVKAATGGMIEIGGGQESAVDATWEFLSTKGEKIVQGKFKEIIFEENAYFTEPLIAFRKDSSFEVAVMKTGEHLKKIEDNIKDIANNHLIIEKNGLFGVLNYDLKIKIPPIYRYIGKLVNNHMIVIDTTGKRSFFNRNFELIADFKYDFVEDYIDGFANVILNGKAGILNSVGKEITQFRFDHSKDSYFTKDCFGLKVVGIGDKLGLIDNRGTEITQIIYDDILYKQQGLRNQITTNEYYGDSIIVVVKDGKYGYINRQGVSISPIIYDWAGGFSNNIPAAIIKKNDKYGLISPDGYEIIKPKIYTDAWKTANGLFVFDDGKKYYYLDWTKECFYGCD